ncbi:MAG: acyltransferase [Variovorax sp.]|nr:acyltransferase [Variovorax sp.]
MTSDVLTVLSSDDRIRCQFSKAKMLRSIRRLQGKLSSIAGMRYLERHGVISDGSVVLSGRWPKVSNEGRMMLGANCELQSFRLRQHFTVRKGAELHIGDQAFLNDGVNVCATRSISIGSHAKIGDMVYIYDTDFHEVAPGMPVRHAPVVIGDNVWIGANSMVLAGATIGDHSVIAAGSIVTDDIPAMSLAAGIPARVIKSLEVPDGWVRK